MIEASAPGRVNLIGEHTDYNTNLMLPTPIPQRTTVELRERSDDLVVVESVELGASAEYRLGDERPRAAWIDYFAAVTGHRASMTATVK